MELQEGELEHLIICTECGVNPVELENLQDEVCSYCLDASESLYGTPRELNFSLEPQRKDDRQSPCVDDLGDDPVGHDLAVHVDPRE